MQHSSMVSKQANKQTNEKANLVEVRIMSMRRGNTLMVSKQINKQTNKQKDDQTLLKHELCLSAEATHL